jgi:hypothetical protein
MDNSWGFFARRIAGLLGIAGVVALLVAATSLASGDTIFATEGQQFSGTVDGSPTCTPTSTPTINWGDGFSSPGSATGPIQGTHIYKEEGTYNGTIDLNCSPTPDTFTATVSDAFLNGSSTTVNTTASQQFSGPVATFTDDSTTANVGEFTALIDWGDGSTSSPADGQQVTISGPSNGTFTVSGTHTYATSGAFSVSVQINDKGGQSTTVFSSANVAKAPPLFTQCPPVFANNGCQYLIVLSDTGTTVQFDPNQGPYEQADDSLIGVQNNSSQPVSALPISTPNSSLFGFESDGLCNPGAPPLPSGCVPAPGAPAGTVCGAQGDNCSFPAPPGQPPGYVEPGAAAPNRQNGYEGPTSWFSNVSPDTSSGQVNFSPAIPPGGSTYFSLEEPPVGGNLNVGSPTLPPPVLGQSFDVKPVSGVVYVKLPGGAAADVGAGGAALKKGAGFVRLTRARQLPAGTQVDARAGSLALTAAAATTNGKLQTGTFGGGVFGLSQDKRGITKGLTTLSLLEGKFKGGPSYGRCTRRAADTGSPNAFEALSSAVVNSMKTSVHGRFRTKGKYGAATARSTAWTMSDRCDGTLTVVTRGTVTVQDFVRHVKVIVRRGHRYLARAGR